jgi:hypothetical protein
MDDSYTILESLKQSLIEMKLMQEGRLLKRSWTDLKKRVNNSNKEE